MSGLGQTMANAPPKMAPMPSVDWEVRATRLDRAHEQLGRTTGFLPRRVPADTLPEPFADALRAVDELPEYYHAGPGTRPWLSFGVSRRLYRDRGARHQCAADSRRSDNVERAPRWLADVVPPRAPLFGNAPHGGAIQAVYPARAGGRWRFPSARAADDHLG